MGKGDLAVENRAKDFARRAHRIIAAGLPIAFHLLMDLVSRIVFDRLLPNSGWNYCYSWSTGVAVVGILL